MKQTFVFLPLPRYLIARVRKLHLFLQIAIVTAALGAPVFGQHRLNDYDRVLPFVAGGFHVVAIETTLVLVNPHEESVEISIESTNQALFEDATLLLEPGEQRRLAIGGEELHTASLRFRAPETVSVSAFIATRETVGGPIISQVTVAAEPLVSSVAIPVYFKTEEISNTGLAVFWREFGRYQIMLFDDLGKRIGWVTRIRNSPTSPDHEVLFLDEVFQTEVSLPGTDGRIPKDFSGWLHIFAGEWQARGFAVTALYSGSPSGLNWSSGSTSIDVLGAYILELEEEIQGAPRAELIQSLADRYGCSFTPGNILGELVLCLDSAAKAFERDSQVRIVEPSEAALPIAN